MYVYSQRENKFSSIFIDKIQNIIIEHAAPQVWGITFSLRVKITVSFTHVD